MQNQDKYEINLEDYLSVLWNGKWVISGLMLTAALIAGVYSFYLAEPVYEAGTVIYLPGVALLDGEEINKQEYLALVQEPEIMQKVFDRLSLEDAGKIPLKNMEIEIKAAELEKGQQEESEEESYLITAKWRNTDRRLVADLLNYWATSFSDEVEEYIKSRNKLYLEKLNQVVDSKEATYIEAEEALLTFKKENNLELLKKRHDINQERLIRLDETIDRVEKDLEVIKAEYDMVRSQLEQTDRFISISTRNRIINTVYLKLEDEKNRLEQTLVRKETELAAGMRERRQLREDIGRSQKVIAENEFLADRLRQDINTAKGSYMLMQTEYNTAEKSMIGENYGVKTVQEAVVPASPVSPDKARNIITAGVLGLLLGLLVVFSREFIRDL